jgi:PIN domain nuclease of toxin-antitoxin system
MRALLDTPILLRWLDDDPRLGETHRTLIADGQNELFVSAVTIAEISIKTSLGKLTAPSGVPDAIEAGGFSHLPLTATHAEALRDLPWHHRDPFDRMLVAQAAVEGLALVTADARMRDYEIECI